MYVTYLEMDSLLKKCSKMQEKHYTEKCSFQTYLKSKLETAYISNKKEMIK